MAGDAGLIRRVDGSQLPSPEGTSSVLPSPDTTSGARSPVRTVADGHRFPFPVTPSVHSMNSTWQRIGQALKVTFRATIYDAVSKTAGPEGGGRAMRDDMRRLRRLCRASRPGLWPADGSADSFSGVQVNVRRSICMSDARPAVISGPH